MRTPSTTDFGRAWTVWLMWLVCLCGLLWGCSQQVVMPTKPQGIPLVKGIERVHETTVYRVIASPTGDHFGTISATEVAIRDAASGDVVTFVERDHLIATLASDDVVISPAELDFSRANVHLKDGGDALVFTFSVGLVAVWSRDLGGFMPAAKDWLSGVRALGFVGEELVWVGRDGSVVASDLDSGDLRISDSIVLGSAKAGRAPNGFVIDSRDIEQVHIDEDGIRVERWKGVMPYPDRAPPMIAQRNTLIGAFKLEVAVLTPGKRYPEVLHIDRRTGALTDKDVIVSAQPDPDLTHYAVAYSQGGIDVWQPDEAALVTTLRVPPSTVSRHAPRLILDIALTRDVLWVLLPDQRLIRYTTDDWQYLDLLEI